MPRPCPAWPSHVVGVGSERAEAKGLLPPPRSSVRHRYLSPHLQPASGRIYLHCEFVEDGKDTLQAKTFMRGLTWRVSQAEASAAWDN